MRSVHLLFVAAFLIFNVGLRIAQGAIHGYTKMADTNGSIREFSGGPSVNNLGAATFIATHDDGRQGVYISTNGTPLTLADTSNGVFSSFGGQPSINDAGVVAFNAVKVDETNDNVFSANGNTLTPIAESSGSQFGSFGYPVVNNAGAVVFLALLDDGGKGIYLNDGGIITTVIDNDGPFTEANSHHANDRGEVVFKQAKLGPIVLANEAGFTIVADSSGEFANVLRPAINNRGDVAFRTALDSGEQSVVLSREGTFTSLADTTGIYSSFYSVSVNDNGMVAFLAELDSGGQGIFTGSDPVADKVIATGDALFGSQVVSVFAERDYLNNSGEVVFRAELENGLRAIVRAEVVPEPASLIVWSLLGASIAVISWRRRRQTS